MQADNTLPCGICGAIHSLDEHHIQPKGMGGSKDPTVESPENKITLCRTCHRNLHDHRWELQRSDQELTVVDPETGELIMRRLSNRDFDAPPSSTSSPSPRTASSASSTMSPTSPTTS